MKNEKRKVKLYIQAEKWNHSNNFEIKVNTFKSQTSEHYVIVDLSEVEIDIEIPSVDDKQLTLEEVKQLKAMIVKEKAQSYARVTSIEEKIQSLLSLEHIS